MFHFQRQRPTELQAAQGKARQTRAELLEERELTQQLQVAEARIGGFKVLGFGV